MGINVIKAGVRKTKNILFTVLLFLFALLFLTTAQADTDISPDDMKAIEETEVITVVPGEESMANELDE